MFRPVSAILHWGIPIVPKLGHCPADDKTGEQARWEPSMAARHGIFLGGQNCSNNLQLNDGLTFCMFFPPHDFEKIRDSDSEGPKVLGMRDVENFMTRLFSTSHWSVLLTVVVLFMCCSCVVPGICFRKEPIFCFHMFPLSADLPPITMVEASASLAIPLASLLLILA